MRDRVWIRDLEAALLEIVAEVEDAVNTAQMEAAPVGSEEDWCAMSSREMVDRIS